MPSPDAISALVLKTIGAVVGTVLALIFKPPRSRRDFQRRATFSVVAGVVLTPIAMQILGQFFPISTDPETIVASATITAFGSWWAAWTFLRLIRSVDKDE